MSEAGYLRQKVRKMSRMCIDSDAGTKENPRGDERKMRRPVAPPILSVPPGGGA